MQYRSMMFAAEVTPDLRERGMRQLFDQVHGNLSRVGDLPGVAFHLQLRRLHAELLCHLPQDRFYGDLSLAPAAQMLECLLSHSQADRLAGNGRDCNETRERAL